MPNAIENSMIVSMPGIAKLKYQIRHYPPHFVLLPYRRVFLSSRRHLLPLHDKQRNDIGVLLPVQLLPTNRTLWYLVMIVWVSAADFASFESFI